MKPHPRFTAMLRVSWLASVVAPMAWALDVSDVLPVIKTLPVPPSIQEGLRLNYEVAVATVADFYGGDDEITNPTGHGLMQVDVIALAPQLSVLRVQPWNYYNYTGPLVPSFGADASLVSYAGGGDWYAHPDALAQASPIMTDNLKILRFPQVVGGQTHDALRIETQDDNTRQVLAYDVPTGYLVYKSSRIKGERGITYSQMSFLGSRQLQFPWSGGLLPRWTTTTSRLAYNGTYTTVVTGSGPFSLPLSADLEIKGAGLDWFLYEQTTTLGSLPGMPPTVEKRTLATGINQLGGLCIPPAALATLNAGQRIDLDSITGTTIDVTQAGLLPNGRNGVTLKMTVGNVAWSETVYDLTTGLALSLKTYSGPSLFYYEASALNLATIPTMPPPLPNAPRLSLQFDRATKTITLSCPTETGRVLNLLASIDGGRNWTPVPGGINMACNSTPFVWQTSASSAASALYCVTVR